MLNRFFFLIAEYLYICNPLFSAEVFLDYKKNAKVIPLLKNWDCVQLQTFNFVSTAGK